MSLVGFRIFHSHSLREESVEGPYGPFGPLTSHTVNGPYKTYRPLNVNIGRKARRRGYAKRTDRRSAMTVRISAAVLDMDGSNVQEKIHIVCCLW